MKNLGVRSFTRGAFNVRRVTLYCLPRRSIKRELSKVFLSNAARISLNGFAVALCSRIKLHAKGIRTSHLYSQAMVENGRDTTGDVSERRTRHASVVRTKAISLYSNHNTQNRLAPKVIRALQNWRERKLNRASASRSCYLNPESQRACRDTLIKVHQRVGTVSYKFLLTRNISLIIRLLSAIKTPIHRADNSQLLRVLLLKSSRMVRLRGIGIKRDARPGDYLSRIFPRYGTSRVSY